jgi:hypothetical protein
MQGVEKEVDMRTQQQRSQFNLLIRSMLVLSVIILFSSSHRVLAQQKDGEGTNTFSNESSNTAPSQPAVNLSYLFANVTLANGEFLEAFGTGSSRGIFRGHPTIAGAELGTTTAHPLMFSTNSIERMRIASNGFVGLGTPNGPLDALHIFNTTNTVGTIRLQGGNNYAGFIGVWEGNPMMLLTNNRHPGTGNNYNAAIAGAQITVGTPTIPGDIAFWTTTPGAVGTNTEIVRIKAEGRVGISQPNPAAKLHVTGVGPNGTAQFHGSVYSTHINWNGDATEDTYIRGGKATSRVIINDLPGGNVLMVQGGGNVGIGTTNPPASKLHVVGNVTVDGNIAAKYQDVAEWVPAAEQFDAGTVVVLDSTKSNHVISGNTSYDTRVAGVISVQPGITLGVKSDDKVLVATTGRVLVNVDATNGPIQIGDLLVTSDREGFAMKSVPVEIGSVRVHRPGTLIGKALEPLRSGTGKILVLLSLQ